MESNMKYYIEYYITEWRHILREFDDSEAFEEAKMQIRNKTGKSVAMKDCDGFDVIIPIEKVILIRSYQVESDE